MMGDTAAGWFAGGVLAFTAGLGLAMPPAPTTAPTIASAAVRAEPPGGTGVTFEVVPASPTTTPTPPTPTPSHGGQLPVTGFNGSVPLLAGLGATLLILGWLVVRRRRPA
ncbi:MULTISPECIES: LPXTG cell wall anchor domain-containing protein [unclassified Micromonospora]|uniref:LPXTG cell wall anchor domain-containing protein n=1 Tax=unclassified Micromonospora TaxID=2617518 RepID=UPI000EF4D2D4|nr:MULTISPECIES: LPXTG cell wall anchor domain-containing protein [unclassified Micromonospora]RLP85050.1 LPXTG cell wall anchor domain-containing protein [Micromonospora sp. BL4]RLP92779.1 LPXTG cell wall anchor domain-containing protein [Micromonospora sp. CV4]